MSKSIKKDKITGVNMNYNNLGTEKLETERLILRKFKIEDAEGMYKNWATDKECNKYLSWDLHKNIDETKKVIQSWIDEYKNGSYNWIVEIKNTHEVIGSITAVHFRKKHSNCELGYCYGSKYWNKGYGTEALKEIIRFFLEDVGLYLVEAHHISGNPASGRIMEKAGMHKDAILKKRRINKQTNKLDDLIIYSINKNELNNYKNNLTKREK